jgi:hypothetical protein
MAVLLIPGVLSVGRVYLPHTLIALIVSLSPLLSVTVLPGIPLSLFLMFCFATLGGSFVFFFDAT